MKSTRLARRLLAFLVCGALLAACMPPQRGPQRPVYRQPPRAVPAGEVVQDAPARTDEFRRELAAGGPLGSGTRLALLLPLHGAYVAAAEMVREGFMAALYSQAAPRPTVRIYDTGANGENLLYAMQQARQEGAGFLIGPLQKDVVAALAAQGAPAVPVLALNYLDSTQFPPGHFFQLGLAPEDEARAAAEQAIAAGLRRAAALAPQNEWGDRVLNAFSRRLLELGGELASAQRYTLSGRDQSEPIRALMGLPESQERQRALSASLGVKLEFDPRRRDDLDFVFVAARAEQGRLLVPQLRFHRLGSLPVYATAQVFDNGTGDADVNGLRYCDMPLMLDLSGRYAALRSQLAEILPGKSRDQQRLFALGYDAYQLLSFLRAGPLPPGGGYPAASGDLSMNPAGAITRGLQCTELSAATTAMSAVAP
jgi:hypothetical protein